jgi:heme exporter protein B
MPFQSQSIAVFLKDFRLEWRSRFGVSTVLAFIASTLLIVLFSLRADLLSVTVQSGLVWIIILFASMTTLSRVFVSESERGTLDLLRLNSPANSVLLGKLIYNFLFTLLITSITLLLFAIMLNMSVERPALLAAVVVLGSSGLAGATTMLGALVSQAARKGAVFPVLALPLLIPLMLLLVRVTQAVFTGGEPVPYANDLAALAGFTGVTITASILLFDNLWED